MGVGMRNCLQLRDKGDFTNTKGPYCGALRPGTAPGHGWLCRSGAMPSSRRVTLSVRERPGVRDHEPQLGFKFQCRNTLMTLTPTFLNLNTLTTCWTFQCGTLPCSSLTCCWCPSESTCFKPKDLEPLPRGRLRPTEPKTKKKIQN
jgi:hypothetical protein